jgi:AcrR family transcriptional regulator
MSPAHAVSIDLRAVAAALAVLGTEHARGTDLARAAGVAKPTLYARFGSREALIEACVENEAEQLIEWVARADPADAIAGYTHDSEGWPLLLLSRHHAAIAARGRVAARIASGRRFTSPALAAAFLAAAAAVLERRVTDDPSLASLARALLR